MSASDPTVTVKKGHILDLRRWLDIPVPPGVINRNRNEFVRMLKSYADDIEVQRLEILGRYAKTDPETKVQNLERPEFEDDNAVKAETEFQDLMKEPVVLMVSKPMALETAKMLLKGLNVKFGIEEGGRYEEVCESLGIKFEEDAQPSPIALPNSGIIVP